MLSDQQLIKHGNALGIAPFAGGKHEEQTETHIGNTAHQKQIKRIEDCVEHARCTTMKHVPQLAHECHQQFEQPSGTLFESNNAAQLKIEF